MRIAPLAEAAGVTVRWRPFLLGDPERVQVRLRVAPLSPPNGWVWAIGLLVLVNFLIRQFHPAPQVMPIAFLQQRIGEHFCQRRRDGERKAAGHFVLRHFTENRNER